MASYRLTKSAKADVASILRASEQRYGGDARGRYAALLLAAMRRIARAPEGYATLDRGDLRPGIRSFHLRRSRDESGEAPVRSPVHVIFYRRVRPGMVEIVRVLHDRMEPKEHLALPS